EQQKKVKEKKEQQAIKLSAYEETVELLKDNDFSNTAFDADGIYCFEKRESARIEAIKKVINGDKDVFLQTYQLSENTIQFLKNNEQQAFWYKTCRGNFLQQVVHQEFIDAISCCEQFTSNFNLSLSEHEKIKNLQNLILNISTTGCQYNQCGKIINAIRLSDVCWSLVDYGHAALQGIGEGIEDIAQLVLHPIKTVESLAHVVNLAASHLGMMIYDTCAVVGGKVFNTKVESNKNRLEQSYQTVIDLLSVAAYQVKNSSVRDLVRGGARFATTCILPGKCIKGIQKFFVSVKPQVVTFCNRLQDSEKVVVAVEGMNVNLAIQAANFTKDIVRKTVTTSKNGLKYGAKLAKPAVIRTRMIASTIKNRACIACKHLTQEYEIIFNQCCNGCKSSSKALVDTYKKGVPSFKNFVDQGLPLRGTSVLFKKVKLGLDETVLMKSLKVFVGKTIRSPGRFGQCLLPEYFVIDKEFLKHIFTGELEFFMNHKGIIKQKLSGFHYEGGLKTKMLELVDVIQDAKTGSYKGGLPFGGNKSMFPVHWSPKKVTEKIVEALGNIVSVEKEGAIFILKGTAKKGIKIEIVIKETGKLITAYPIV
ncbi:EndoU domain-containing protein, partial [bacterium]|nr:EndoU domain-containing protein [bacterium]